jgi:hypothetical protein
MAWAAFSQSVHRSSSSRDVYKLCVNITSTECKTNTIKILICFLEEFHIFLVLFALEITSLN